jgi:hypothetical protein
MAKIRNNFATATTVLAAAVANSASFTVAYPSGTSQLSFTAGLAAAGSYMIVNSNDSYSVADGKISISYDASLITITNSTGATLPAGSSIQLMFEMVDGNSRIPFVIPLPPLATITAADIVTEMRPGIAGTIEYWEFVTTIAATTAAKAATLNLEIDTTNVTGGTIALTSANVTPKGVVVPASAITGANVLTRESKLSVEASAVTAFAEGEGYLVVYIRPTQNDAY